MTDELMGKALAHCGDEAQAEFFNALGREARRTWRDPLGLGGYDMQVSRIVDHLDTDGRGLIKRLHEFIVSDEETPRVVKRIVYEDVVEKRVVEAEEEPS